MRIFYYAMLENLIYLMAVLDKKVAGNLTAKQLKALAAALKEELDRKPNSSKAPWKTEEQNEKG